MAIDLIPNIKKENNSMNSQNSNQSNKEYSTNSNSNQLNNQNSNTKINSVNDDTNCEESKNSNLNINSTKEEKVQDVAKNQNNVTNGKFCNNCGNEMSIGYDGNVFCPKCGFKPNGIQDKNKTDKKNKKELYSFIIKTIIWIGLGLLLIYLVSLFIGIMEDTLNIFT
jgi:RNA polymerase-binding transcription factor DksA